MNVSDAVFVINRLLPEPHAGLLAGMLFGVQSSITKELHEALITTGTLHIVALSGMNISLLTGYLSVLLLRIWKRPIANFLAIALIVWFIWFVGPTPSVVRAGIMGSITLVGISLGRQIWPVFIWILAVISMLLLNPLWITEVSFQLSVMATLGILLFGPTKQSNSNYTSDRHPAESPQISFRLFTEHFVRRFLVQVKGIFWQDLQVTLAAQVFTIPIMFFSFHRISFAAPLSNMLTGWLIPIIMAGGFVLVVFGMIWLPLGAIAAYFVWFFLSMLVRIIMLAARMPFASLDW